MIKSILDIITYEGKRSNDVTDEEEKNKIDEIARIFIVFEKDIIKFQQGKIIMYRDGGISLDTFLSTRMIKKMKATLNIS